MNSTSLFSGRTRTRRALATAGLVILGAGALTACGSKTSDTAAAAAESCVDTSGDTIKVGSLHSLSGTMAISEKTVRDSVALAIEQIVCPDQPPAPQIELLVHLRSQRGRRQRGGGGGGDSARANGRGRREAEAGAA